MNGFVDPLYLDAYQFERFALLDPDRAAALLQWVEARQAAEGRRGPMFSVQLGEGWIEIVQPVLRANGESLTHRGHVVTDKYRIAVSSPPPCWPTPAEMETIT